MQPLRYLLDTNVISEWAKPRPSERVTAWLSQVDEDATFVSVISLAELRYGVGVLASGNRSSKLDRWLKAELPARFEGRFVPIDADVAEACGRLRARRKIAGRPIGDRDSLIGATAEVNGMTLVTRDVADFGLIDIKILNPWE